MFQADEFSGALKEMRYVPGIRLANDAAQWSSSVLKRMLRWALPPAAHRRLKGFIERLSYPNLAAKPGHFYSPLVDLSEAREALSRARGAVGSEILGISIDLILMEMLWQELVPFIKSAYLSEERAADRAYFLNNEFYPYGDAVILNAMLRHFRPGSVVEIGSGFSSALCLDVQSEHGTPERLTFIDPHLARYEHLAGQNRKQAKTINKKVQEVDVNEFEKLKSGDFLIVDSSHVLKTGSDIVTILFDILPRLKPGVLVHFHDIFWPFEYPESWVIERECNWNEIYALRAFLMFNSEYEIVFFNDAFAQLCAESARSGDQRFATSPGAAIWLRRRLPAG
jgi:predicted O-methyltransferase YrrM